MFTLLLVAILTFTACSSGSHGGPAVPTNGGSSSQVLSINEHGLVASVQPVTSAKVSGTITVQINALPADARQILFIFKPKNLPASENPFAAPNVIAKFLEPNPQQVSVDTSSVANGDYELYMGVSPKDASQGWLAESKTDLEVLN